MILKGKVDFRKKKRENLKEYDTISWENDYNYENNMIQTIEKDKALTIISATFWLIATSN